MANSIFQWLMVGFVALVHPFFVSVIELNHNAKDKTVEISVRVFTDDFEATLKKFGNTTIDLTNPTNKTKLDQLIVDYVRQKLSIQIDGKATVLEYVGYEVKKESVWIYFEIDKIASLKKVAINCNFLYDFEAKQINIFHVKANGKEESYKLEYPKTTNLFSL